VPRGGVTSAAGRWTAREVLSYAPGSRSARAARSLAVPWPWTGLGAAGDLVWGHCQGSAPEPYRTCVGLAGPVFWCSCPSRKHPCKHALALALLASAGQVPAGEPPGWARQRITAAALKPAARRRAPDPQAQARRAAARAGRISAGLAELDQWLQDLVRAGFATAQARPASSWADMAARLVDAQAPGAAGLVRQLGGTMRSGGGWEERALAQAGRLHLLASAWARLPDLDEPTRAAVRARVGWPVPAEDVLAGPATRDRWHVAGRWETPGTDGDRLRVQRTWLWGEACARPALVLEFALPGSAFRTSLVPGTVISAEVAFYPGAAPLRALVAAQLGPPEPMARMPGWASIAEAFAAHGGALARDPWLDRWPVLLGSVIASGDGLHDPAGTFLPVRGGPDWRLAALSGGHPIGVMGELDEGTLRPLAAVAGGRYVAL
jgi:hypothetical protein